MPSRGDRVAEPVGIDLGTTYSLIGSVGPTGVRIYQSSTDQRSTPSVVQIQPGGAVCIGEEAKRSAALYPERTFAFFKRDMGVPGANRTVDGTEWSPEQLSSEVLKSLVEDYARDGRDAPQEVVITVPAYFGDAARRATITAGELAGLNVLELIHEPTAAALAFGFGAGASVNSTLLVYDLGGGTFDVSLVEVGAGQMTVLATDGDHELGGKDWDDVLITIVADRFNERHGSDPRWDLTAAADLRERCEIAKRSLSKMPGTSVPVVVDGLSDRVPVSRQEFEEMSAPLLGRTETLLDQLLDESGFAWEQVDAMLLVGGSTRMPACAALVKRLSGRPAVLGVDPDTAVAHGAALVAARRTLGGNIAPGRVPGLTATGGHSSDERAPEVADGISRLPALRDVTAHALGFVVINPSGDRYANEVMIARNSQIPARQTQTKRLERGMSELDVYVLQGHQERPRATESLGRYRFRSVPNEEQDRDLQITFMYDNDGIVRVSAALSGVDLAAPEHDPGDRDLSWTDEDPRDHARSVLDVVLLMDCSGSMSGGRLTEAKRSCADFVNVLADIQGARVGLVSFSTHATLLASLSEESAPVIEGANRMHASGGTDLAAGLREARALLDGAEGRRVIVAVTDGSPNDANAAVSIATACRREDVEIVAVGVSGADDAFLAKIATTDKDSIFTNDMRGALHSIARSLAGGITRRA